jgi:hypothetical protein
MRISGKEVLAAMSGSGVLDVSWVVSQTGLTRVAGCLREETAPIRCWGEPVGGEEAQKYHCQTTIRIRDVQERTGQDSRVGDAVDAMFR